MDGQLSSKSSAFWVLLALTAASVEPVVVKLGYRSGATTLQLIVYRNLFAAAAILVVTRKWRWLGWRLVGMAASVAVLLLATNGLVLYALNHMSAVSVITAMTTTPAFVAIVNQLRGRDVLGPKFWTGFVACFLGVLLTVGAFDRAAQTFHAGAVIALAVAVASSTTYRTRMEAVTRAIAPREVSTYIFLINAVLASVVIMPWIEPLPATTLPIVGWIGVAAAVANLAFLSALRLVGSTRMSMFDMLQRPLVIVGAAVLLGEPLTAAQVAGVALVLVGIHLAKVTRRVPAARLALDALAPIPRRN